MPCGKALLRIIRGILFIFPNSTRMAQAGWHSKFINCFRNVITRLSVNVRKSITHHFVNFRKTVFANNCFIDYLHRKLLTANFLFYGIESAKKNKCHLLDLILKQ